MEPGRPDANSRMQRTSGPLPLGNIGTPFLPVADSIAIFFEPLLLCGEVLVVVDDDHDWRRVCVAGDVASSDAVILNAQQQQQQQQHSRQKSSCIYNCRE
jgi:hypothetical protein